MAATMGSETTAAATGKVGEVRRDPMAMLPFCGYNVGDYFAHWLEMGKKVKTPKIFGINWFLTDADGKFIWPGFGENMRVLKWMFERVHGTAEAQETEIGYIPRYQDIDFTGLESVDEKVFDKLTTVDKALWQQELELHNELFETVEDKLPPEAIYPRRSLNSHLNPWTDLIKVRDIAIVIYIHTHGAWFLWQSRHGHDLSSNSHDKASTTG